MLLSKLSAGRIIQPPLLHTKWQGHCRWVLYQGSLWMPTWILFVWMIKTIITELCHWKTLHRKMQMCEKEDREHAYVRPVSHLIPSVAHFHKNCLSLAAQILVFSSEKNRNIAVMTIAHFIKQQYAVGKRKCQIIFWCYREKILAFFTYIYSSFVNFYFKE